MLRIAPATPARREAEPMHRLQQKLPQLLVALAISPVADPHDIACFSAWQRMKERRVGGLVPREHAMSPAALLIDLAQQFSKREHPVVTVEIKGFDFIPGAHGAVVRVVKKQQI